MDGMGKARLTKNLLCFKMFESFGVDFGDAWGMPPRVDRWSFFE